MTPRFFGYARKSPTGFTSGQTANDPIPSLDRQESDLYKMAERFPECAYAGCFREHESAVEVAWNKRPVFKTLLSDLRKGDHLGLWRLDRLEREPFRLMAALKTLVDLEVTIHVDQAMGGLPVDLNTTMGRGLVMMLAMSADLQKGFQVDGIKRGLAWRKQCGLAMGWIPPLGCKFVLVPGKKTRLGNPERRVEWNDEECAVIREIRNRIKAGETFAELARDFKANKRMRVPKVPWSYNLLRKAYAFYDKLLAEGKDLGGYSLSENTAEAFRQREEEIAKELEEKQTTISLHLNKERHKRDKQRQKAECRVIRERREKAKAEAAKPKKVPEWAIRLWRGEKPFSSASEQESSVSSQASP